ncbi:hypothetical protein V8F20_004034 [Naviculisporaceae sp. PSN 640]
MSNPFKQSHARKISSASGLPISNSKIAKVMIPRDRDDRNCRPIEHTRNDLDQDILSSGLEHVSRYVAMHGKKIEVVAVGGAINVLRLLSRRTTHDVNIIISGLENTWRTLLDNAAYEAYKKIPDLGSAWLTTDAENWVSDNVAQQLTRMATQQNVTLYQGEGLVVYAAPWEYAFIAKIHRIQTDGENARDYDMHDALRYLHHYIRSNWPSGSHPVPDSQIQEWARYWRQFEVKTSLLNDIQKAYKRAYGGQRGITIEQSTEKGLIGLGISGMPGL